MNAMNALWFLGTAQRRRNSEISERGLTSWP